MVKSDVIMSDNDTIITELSINTAVIVKIYINIEYFILSCKQHFT